jgi:hypothetical protein
MANRPYSATPSRPSGLGPASPDSQVTGQADAMTENTYFWRLIRRPPLLAHRGRAYTLDQRLPMDNDATRSVHDGLGLTR